MGDTAAIESTDKREVQQAHEPDMSRIELEHIAAKLEAQALELQRQLEHLDPSSEEGQRTAIALAATKEAAGKARMLVNSGARVSVSYVMSLQVIANAAASVRINNVGATEAEEEKRQDQIAHFYDSIPLSAAAEHRISILCEIVDVHDETALRRHLHARIDPSLSVAEQERIIALQVKAAQTDDGRKVYAAHNEMVRTQGPKLHEHYRRVVKLDVAVEELLKRYPSGDIHDQLMTIKRAGLTNYESEQLRGTDSVAEVIGDLYVAKHPDHELRRRLDMVVEAGVDARVDQMAQYPQAVAATGRGPVSKDSLRYVMTHDKPRDGNDVRAKDAVEGTADIFRMKAAIEVIQRSRTQGKMHTAIDLLSVQGTMPCEGHGQVATSGRIDALVSLMKRDPQMQEKIARYHLTDADLQATATQLITQINAGGKNGFEKVTGVKPVTFTEAMGNGWNSMTHQGDYKQALHDADDVQHRLEDVGYPKWVSDNVGTMLRGGAAVGSAYGQSNHVLSQAQTKKDAIDADGSKKVNAAMAKQDWGGALSAFMETQQKKWAIDGQSAAQLVNVANDTAMKSTMLGRQVQLLGVINDPHLDLNGDKTVTLQEEYDFLKAHGFSQITDLNGDKHIDAKDLKLAVEVAEQLDKLQGFAKLKDPSKTGREAKIGLIDTDGDGKISGDEVIAAFKKAGIKLSDVEDKHGDIDYDKLNSGLQLAAKKLQTPAKTH